MNNKRGLGMNLKKYYLTGTLLGSILFSACAPDSKSKVSAPECSAQVIQAFENIDEKTSLYTRTRKKAHLKSILSSCREVETLLIGKSCAVIEPYFKDPVIVSFENIRRTCESAASY